MGRPAKVPSDRFSSREIAYAAGLSPRNFSLLFERGLAPETVDSAQGRGGHRLYDGVGLSHATLVGALHLAGLPLLLSARLGMAFAEQFGLNYGRLPSNLEAYLQAPLNPRPGYYPWPDENGDDEIDLDKDCWLHNRLRGRTDIYRRGRSIKGDLVIDIADQAFVSTQLLDIKIKFHSVTSGGLPVNPEYRIVGSGAAVRVVPIWEGFKSFDFIEDTDAAEKMKRLEAQFMEARANAVARVKVNVSLSIRNGFDRLYDIRSATNSPPE